MAALPWVKILFVAFLCFACEWCDCATTTNEVNIDVADVAIGALFTSGTSTELHLYIFPILKHFARESNLGQSRIALIDDNQNARLKLEDGVSIDAVNTALEKWIFAYSHSDSDFRKSGNEVRKTIFPKGATTRPQIVFLFIGSMKGFQRDLSEAVSEDGADIVVVVTANAATATYEMTGYEKDYKTVVRGQRWGRIAHEMIDLVRRPLKRCPFVKNVTDCFYNATRSCLAHVRYGGYPPGARYCLKQDPATIRCPFGGIQSCEGTCSRRSKWTKCNATWCGQAGEQWRIANRSDPMTAHCSQVTVACRHDCFETVSRNTSRRKRGAPPVEVVGTIVLSVSLTAGVISLGIAVYCCWSQLKKDDISTTTTTTPHLSVTPTTVTPPSPATISDERTNQRISERDKPKSAPKVEPAAASVSAKSDKVGPTYVSLGSKSGSVESKIEHKSIEIDMTKEASEPTPQTLAKTPQQKPYVRRFPMRKPF